MSGGLWWSGSFHTTKHGNLLTLNISQVLHFLAEKFSRNDFLRSAVLISHLISQKMFGELLVKSKRLQWYFSAFLAC